MNTNINWHQDVREITTLKDMLESSMALYGSLPAFHVKAEKGAPYLPISYKQLKREVDALGTQLLAMGLQGEKIAVIGENCYEWVVSYYAVANGVGVVVPLDKELRKEEVDTFLEAAGCTAVFYTKSHEKYFEDRDDLKYRFTMEFYGDRTDLDTKLPDEIKGNIIEWKNLVGAGELLLDQGSTEYLDMELDPNEMRILLFTSGTTGKAKGVMLSHRNITSDVMDTCRLAQVFPTDKTLSVLPIHHTYESTMGIVLVNFRGASTAFCEGLKHINKNLQEIQATVFIAVPLILEAIYDKIWKQAEKTGKAQVLRKGIQLNRRTKRFGIDLSRKLFKQIHQALGGKIRLLITGAAAMDPNVFRGFEDLGIIVQQGYGLTECSPLVSGTPDFAPERYKKAGSVGPSIMHGEIKIVDADENGIGEIVFRGPNVMLGYYNMPEETAEVLKDGWFYTGDLGFLDKDGWLYITGRKKNIIVTKTGKNIYPEELETYVNRSPFILESMVFSAERDGNDVVGVQIIPDYEAIEENFGRQFVGDELQELMKKQIREINENLVSYKRIREVILRKDDFVRTTTKKIKRQENTETNAGDTIIEE